MYPSATVVPGLLGDVEFLGEEAGKKSYGGKHHVLYFLGKICKIIETDIETRDLKQQVQRFSRLLQCQS